jgi:tRNA A37 methylthiotransferase MiaB
MSRSEEDWNEARSRVIEARRLLRESIELIDDFPVGFSEETYTDFQKAISLFREMEGFYNRAIGALTVTIFDDAVDNHK